MRRAIAALAGLPDEDAELPSASDLVAPGGAATTTAGGTEATMAGCAAVTTTGGVPSVETPAPASTAATPPPVEEDILSVQEAMEFHLGGLHWFDLVS